MTARAGGGAYLRKYWNANQSEIYSKFLTNIGPLQIWLVHGRVIRDKVFIDFTEGGNSNAYQWLPPFQIVLDADATAQELKFTQLHELTEYNAMAKGIGYETAHSNYANPVEQKARSNPALWPQLWAQQKKIFIDRLQANLTVDLNHRLRRPRSASPKQSAR